MTFLVQDEPSPARALNSQSGSIKLLFHLVQGAEVAVDRVCETTWLEDAARAGAVLGTVCSRGEILPEE